jgi:small subunit ribosomal protein S8
MDTIANFITIIRNGYLAKKDTVVAKHTLICEEIAKLLVSDGFIASYTVENTKPAKKIIVTLQYFDKNLPAITGIKRISTGSVRIYSGFHKMPQALSGAGTTIVSTSKGLMTGKTAREKHLGGEVICQVW